MTTAENLERILMVYFFPLQFTVGLIGNILNLIVLLNKRMRTKTNVLLAILAVDDIFFLLFMLPFSFIYYPNLLKIREVNVFYVYATQHLAGILNLCSFVSAWIIVLLSIERFTCIIWPLKARLYLTYNKLRFFVICILISAVVSSLHFHITHQVVEITRRITVENSTTGEKTVIEKQKIRPMIREGWESYWRISTILDIFLIVFIPVAIVVFSNVSIVLTLRKKRPTTNITKNETSQIDASCNQSSITKSVKNQRRATLIVVIIASSFTLCQIPSAITHIIEIIWPEIGFMPQFKLAATLTNSLVITTKTLNLFLFCMWSSNFRKNLVRIILQKFDSSTLRFLKHVSLKGSGNGYVLKTKTQLNYASEPATNITRPFPSLVRTPTLLQLRHSLPSFINADQNDMKKMEQIVLLT